MAPQKNSRPYLKIASTLVLLGMSLFMIERFGLGWASGPGHDPVHFDPTVLSILVIAPVALIVSGCLIFAVGSMIRRR